jgi:hypothetical protein
MTTTKIQSECTRLSRDARVLMQTVRNLEFLARKAGQEEVAERLDVACTDIHEAACSLGCAADSIHRETPA